MSEEERSNPFAHAADLLIGAIDYSAQRIVKAVEGLAERGKMSREEASKAVKEMAERGREEREKLRAKLETTFARLRFVSRAEFEELKARLERLEECCRTPEEESD